MAIRDKESILLLVGFLFTTKQYVNHQQTITLNAVEPMKI
jgi:hypothetical protein